MSCIDIFHSERAWLHFYDRYELRGINKLITLNELEKYILQNYVSGKIQEDKKHPGREGPRYRIHINIGNKLITVIVEKTGKCLLPITVWSQNLR